MPLQPAGIIPALVTPLNADETLDEPALCGLVEHLIGCGVHGLFAASTQGEAYALSPAERLRVIELVVETAAGRVPVYAGTGAISTRETVALTQAAERLGAAAASVITPSFISPSPAELYDHYLAVARAAAIPLLLYPNPDRTGVRLSVELVQRLAAIETIVGIKDSGGDLTLMTEYIRHCGPAFSVLSGRDTLILATLVSGGTGAIAATANVAPRIALTIYQAFQAGDPATARAAQERLAELRMAFSLGSFPVVIKEALALQGLCSARALAPIAPLPETQRTTLRAILERLDLLQPG
jgi:4-hydroxy-tetrahydrodipicolinate synthase